MRRHVAAALWASAFTTAACTGGDTGTTDSAAGTATPAASAGVALTGAGATFPYPIYQKWFDDYAAKTGVKINYQSIGSGGGIRQISESTVDFGASDAPMTDEDMAKAKGGPIFHFPTVVGADVITYNLPGVTQSLQLTGEVIADIFLGKITKWNDARIATLNAGVNLPAGDILVVHRSDGSGTTYVFTDYLTTVSPAWASGPGKGTAIKWPVGIGGKGNEGVAGQVKQTPGSIAYVELAYAKQNNLPVASVKNAAGNFVTPTIESLTAAAAGSLSKFPPNTDYRVSIVNPSDPKAYPIASFTWLLVYQRQADPAKGKKLVDFMRWALTEGEASAAALDYAAIPPELVSRLLERLSLIQVGPAT